MLPNPPRLIDEDDEPDPLGWYDEPPVERYPDPPNSHTPGRDRYDDPAGGGGGAQTPLVTTHGRWYRSYGTCGSGIGWPFASSTRFPCSSVFHRSGTGLPLASYQV